MEKEFTEDMFNNPKNYIPKGVYCHGKTRNDICPFWDIDETKSEQENGYCHYLQKGDWDLNPEYNAESKITYSKDSEDVGKSITELFGEHFPSSLLWDQCKECDINDEYEEE